MLLSSCCNLDPAKLAAVQVPFRLLSYRWPTQCPLLSYRVVLFAYAMSGSAIAFGAVCLRHVRYCHCVGCCLPAPCPVLA